MIKNTCLFAAFVAFCSFVPGVFAALPGLIPLPVAVEEKIGEKPFVLSEKTQVSFEPANSDAARAGTFFAQTAGLKIAENSQAQAAAGTIFFRIGDAAGTLKNDPEAYELRIGENRIEITALGYGGFFYATQTLRQLLPAGAAFGNVPACRIVDFPRFKWRGMMLDSCRHYQDPAWIKKLIDMLASQKINTLHWHLTEDQAWRIEIKKYPKLTESAAWRKGIGFGLNPADSTHYNAAGQYGGFYSQEQIKEIVAYAAARNITIVPEIELPGHALAALTVYPHLGCTGGPYEMGMKGGVFDDVYCAGTEAVYAFLEDVFDEVLALFPSKIIHVGGDECPKKRWKACPKCQAKIKAENLKDEHELQSYVIKRIEKYLAQKGRHLIGWDEILEGGLPERALVMSWRGAQGGIIAASAGHDVVMTPTGFCYFDYSQARTGEPRSIGGFVPLEKVYNFNPTAGVPADKHAHVLGGQANLWTEYIPNEKHTEYMIAPRISALAEVVWTPQARRNADDFFARIVDQYARYEAMDFNYRRPEGIVIRETEKGIVFDPDLKHATIVYTTDGSAPTLESPRFAGTPLKFSTGTPITIKACAVINGKLARINKRTVRMPKAKVVSTLGTVEGNFPARAIDGTRTTVYWADRAPRAGDTVAIFFDDAQIAGTVRAVTGKNENGGGGDRLVHGVLEISSDGNAWTEIAKFSDGIALGNVPAGTRIKAVRLRATGTQNEWLVVREFELEK